MVVLFYGKGGEIRTNRRDEQELAVFWLHLLQSSLVYINTPVLAGSGRPVQDDDLARLAHRYHGPSLQLVSVVLDEDRGKCFSGHQSC